MGKKVSDIIGAQPRDIHWISPQEKLTSVVSKMVDNHICCMLVKDGDNYTGIVTEHDVTLCLASCDYIYKTKVSYVISHRLRFVEPEDTLEHAGQVMRAKGIRHLPVFDGSSLVYVLSIRDLAFAEIDDLQGEVKVLSDYISAL